MGPKGEGLGGIWGRWEKKEEEILEFWSCPAQKNSGFLGPFWFSLQVVPLEFPPDFTGILGIFLALGFGGTGECGNLGMLIPISPQEIPQQMNGSDCGMFACRYAECISKDKPINFTQVPTFPNSPACKPPAPGKIPKIPPKIWGKSPIPPQNPKEFLGYCLFPTSRNIPLPSSSIPRSQHSQIPLGTKPPGPEKSKIPQIPSKI